MPMQTRLQALPVSRLLLAIATLMTATGCPGGSAEEGDGEGPSDATSATGGRGNFSAPLSSRATGGATGRNASVGTVTGGSAMTGVANIGGVANTTDSHAGNVQGGASGASAGRTEGSTVISPTLGGAAMQSHTASASGGKSVTSLASGGKTNHDATASGGKSGSVGGSAARGGSSAHGASTALGGSAGGTKSVGTTLQVGGTASSGGSTSTKASGSDLLVPESGALLGLYYGDASIAATATKLGCNVPMHLTYYAWTDDWTQDNTVEDLRAGRIPFVNWELFGAVLDDIIAGKNDTMIKQRAVAAKNLGKKLFLDFGAEMNGDWSPWSGAENGKSADKYIAAYRHVHDLFVQNGATNVIWAFCPNVTSEPVESWNEPLDYYPGDTYVDWMCVDGYNWGKSETWGMWQSFQEVFADIYPALASKNKPIIIGEMASTELGGSKGEWISQIIPTLKRDFPLIKGLVWFDINKETDWRISSSSASEAAFKAMANDPWFKQ